MVFASKNYLEKREFFSRINYFEKLKKYSSDFYREELIFKNLKILKDEYVEDLGFNLENIYNYLKIDHEVNAINPKIDENNKQNKS